ncbi:uncharacterized protein BDR25DRAFT_318713 [Lindgomyces ingoldianus]|uniref:Uncharacterized protein n=1 Tax=Lindgomyces ingoldianus TaxID=673940 RepID=A0ACB6QDK7_9PLEO|nr:uncharacterized protein BDR25DRAFT_318713 [Lindgomyces ingoldianus]KAF2464994.1 hypothetical protein BDR25DRAFT_318713 [Lindgomyces ingoldianus]
MVAPATDHPGQGGRSGFIKYAILTVPTEFNLVPAGAPSVGTDPHNPGIWYYNGTPAVCAFVGPDSVLPRCYKDWGAPGILVAGPNFGTNMGPLLYTLREEFLRLCSLRLTLQSRISTSRTRPTQRRGKPQSRSNNAAIHHATEDNQLVFPLGYSVNVNILPLTNDTVPEIVATRLTGEADVDIAAFNESSGPFHYQNIAPKSAGVDVCYNVDCSLPGETHVVEGGAYSVHRAGDDEVRAAGGK